MHHFAGLVQDKARHQQDEHGRDRQRKRGDAEDRRADAGQKRDQHAHHDKPAHEAEILAGGQGIAGQPQEDRAGAAHRGHHQLPAVGERGQVVADHGAERQAHKAGQGKYRGQAPGAVAQGRGQE